MAEPKPLPDCSQCDHLCEQLDDAECLGNLTKEERQAVYESIAQAYLGKYLDKWGVMYFDNNGNQRHDP